MTILNKLLYPRKCDTRFRSARIWSNNELRKIAHLFSNDIINVSGWADEDKQGKTYREYFVNAKSYTISNLNGGPQIGKKIRLKDSIAIDLTEPIKKSLEQKFDVVFTHTVLEHIFDISMAIDNLCRLSQDIIITVVPFMQVIHISDGEAGPYRDYWRFTPYCLDALYKKHGFETIYIRGTDFKFTSVYYLHVCSKNPAKWKKVFPDKIDFQKIPNGDLLYK